jgi:hypothetical protein
MRSRYWQNTRKNSASFNLVNVYGEDIEHPAWLHTYFLVSDNNEIRENPTEDTVFIRSFYLQEGEHREAPVPANTGTKRRKH